MKKDVSLSMSLENDPHFDIITPICKVCKNSIDGGKCKIYGDRPQEYKYAKKYDCPNKVLDRLNIAYKDISKNCKHHKGE